VHRIEVLIQGAGDDWLRFVDPVRIVEARRADDVAGALAEVERLCRETGRVAVGFVTYEAAAAFGLAVRPSHDPSTLPLVWFGLFDAGVRGPLNMEALAPSSGDYEVGPRTTSVDRAGFDAVFRRIKDYLAKGETYQVGYTFRVNAAFSGSARSLFGDLVAAQGGRHSAFIDLCTHVICSASPELFFHREGSRVVARPMKGTAPRGRTAEEDRARRDGLRASAKQRAENVMIVDMMRNDLGRVAEVGSVHVPELFTIERYPNVWQMTSLVTAETRASLPELFAALHPSASVTGAPKVRTMEILTELEREPRGVYTGAIGYVNPDGSAHFNVAIRTAVVDRPARSVSFGIGSGIVWDSVGEEEYAECLVKSSVLGVRPEPFDLLETMRWSLEDGVYLIDRHLRRLRESAEYFGYPYDHAAVTAALDSMSARGPHDVGTGLRVRLLLSSDGQVRVECGPLVSPPTPLRVAIAATAIDVSSRFMYHKTTRRSIYDKARADGPMEVDDVILWNGLGQVTEATTANIVADLGDGLLTPPVACGLLAGTCRAEALATGRVREAELTVDDLRRANRIWLINSVHGWREAELKDSASR
jgi:para-aminobenzoate synthetase / 4-amino-4-deoxychorismate lyase